MARCCELGLHYGSQGEDPDTPSRSPTLCVVCKSCNDNQKHVQMMPAMSHLSPADSRDCSSPYHTSEACFDFTLTVGSKELSRSSSLFHWPCICHAAHAFCL